jgi:hypothetical protein
MEEKSGVSKIFRTDAVKTIKLTIRPIGSHYPRSRSLPHVDTGPTVSSSFGTLPGSPFLSVSSTLCDSVWISSMLWNRRPFSFSFILEIGRSQDDRHLFFAWNCWARTEAWDGTLSWWSSQVCSRQNSGRLLRTFSRSRRKIRGTTRNSQFGLLGPVLRATTTAV